MEAFFVLVTLESLQFNLFPIKHRKRKLIILG